MTRRCSRGRSSGRSSTAGRWGLSCRWCSSASCWCIHRAPAGLAAACTLHSRVRGRTCGCSVCKVALACGWLVRWILSTSASTIAKTLGSIANLCKHIVHACIAGDLLDRRDVACVGRTGCIAGLALLGQHPSAGWHWWCCCTGTAATAAQTLIASVHSSTCRGVIGKIALGCHSK